MVGFLTEYAQTIEGSAPVWTVIMNAFDDMVQQLGNDYFAEYVGIFARNLASTLAAQSIDSRPSPPAPWTYCRCHRLYIHTDM